MYLYLEEDAILEAVRWWELKRIAIHHCRLNVQIKPGRVTSGCRFNYSRRIWYGWFVNKEKNLKLWKQQNNIFKFILFKVISNYIYFRLFLYSFYSAISTILLRSILKWLHLEKSRNTSILPLWIALQVI